MEDTQENQWIYCDTEIAATPSICDGLSAAEERLRRAKGISFINNVGSQLHLSQMVVWVASVFFHRFYMRKSMVEEKGGTHHYNIAATSVFLANKTEESCRKTKDVIIAVVRAAQKNPSLQIDEQSKEYWRWRDSMIHNEETMLEWLSFDLTVDNPFDKLLEYTRELGRCKELMQAAWAFLCDVSMTALPLMFEAADLALGAIFFASVYSGKTIPDLADGRPWWHRFKTPESTYEKIIEVITTFYNENPLNKAENPMQSNRVSAFVLENTRATSEHATPSTIDTPAHG